MILDVVALKRVQRRFTRALSGLEDFSNWMAIFPGVK